MSRNETYDEALHDAISHGINMAEVALEENNEVSQELFLKWVWEGYCNSPAAGRRADEPDNLEKAVKTRATEVWADDIEPRVELIEEH